MFNRRTILLVEDNDDDVFIMQNTFKKASVTNPVHVLTDGEQAISYLSGEGRYGDRQQFPLPVIIFLDINMPKKSGLEVLEWIRQQPRLKKLTVHMLTASSRPVDVERAAELNANAYLVKPSRMEQLLEMVESWYAVSQFAAYPEIS
jgi:CheY-like chemotaxis protein